MIKILNVNSENKAYSIFADENGMIIGIARHTEEGYEMATLENQKLMPNGKLGFIPGRVCYSPFVASSLEQVATLFRNLAGDTCKEAEAYPHSIRTNRKEQAA